MSTFSERIRDERNRTKKKQSEIAEYLGTSVQSYSAYETVREPGFEVLCKLADYYGVTADYLLGRTDTRINTHEDLDKIVEAFNVKNINLENPIEWKIKFAATGFMTSAFTLLREMIKADDFTSAGLMNIHNITHERFSIIAGIITFLTKIVEEEDIKYNEYVGENNTGRIPKEQLYEVLLDYNKAFSRTLSAINEMLLLYHVKKAEKLRDKLEHAHLQKPANKID